MSEFTEDISPPLVLDTKKEAPNGELVRVMKVAGDPYVMLMVEDLGAVEVHFATLTHLLRKLGNAEADELIKRSHDQQSAKNLLSRFRIGNKIF